MKSSLIPENDNSAFRKAQEAIAVLPRNGRLTLLDRRFFNVLLALAQEQGDRTTYRARFSRILSGAKFDSKNTEVAKEHIRKMATTTVEWNSTSEVGKRRWGISNLIADAEVIEENRELYVEWSYSPKIKAKLLNPDVYVQLSLEIHSSLRSSQSAALYEICSRYVTNPGQLTHRAPWQWWKPRLTGNPEDIDDQAEYKYFKRDVLKMAISEINKITDLNVELIEHKAGRRVGEIQFRVQKKPQQALFLDEANLIDNSILERLEKIGLASNAAAKIYSENEEGQIRITLDYVEARLRDRRMEPVKSPAALFRAALKGGYAKDNLPPPRLTTDTKKVKHVVQATLLDDQPIQTVNAHAQVPEYRAKFTSMNPIDQATWLNRFTESSSFPAVRSFFMTQGLASPIAANAFYAWLAASLENP